MEELQKDRRAQIGSGEGAEQAGLEIKQTELGTGYTHVHT